MRSAGNCCVMRRARWFQRDADRSAGRPPGPSAAGYAGRCYRRPALCVPRLRGHPRIARAPHHPLRTASTDLDNLVLLLLYHHRMHHRKDHHHRPRAPARRHRRRRRPTARRVTRSTLPPRRHRPSAPSKVRPANVPNGGGKQPFQPQPPPSVISYLPLTTGSRDRWLRPARTAAPRHRSEMRGERRDHGTVAALRPRPRHAKINRCRTAFFLASSRVPVSWRPPHR